MLILGLKGLTDTQGGNKKCLYQRGVRIMRVEFRGNLRAFFLQGRSKLRKAEFDCKLCRTFKNPHTVRKN